MAVGIRRPGWNWWLVTFVLAMVTGYAAMLAGQDALVSIAHMVVDVCVVALLWDVMKTLRRQR